MAVVDAVAAEESGAAVHAHGVLAVVEIASPSTRITDCKLKPALYAAAHIAHSWRIELEPALRLLAGRLEHGSYTDRAPLLAGAPARVDEPFPIAFNPGSLVGRQPLAGGRVQAAAPGTGSGRVDIAGGHRSAVSVPAAGRGVVVGMGLMDQAGPGIEERADRAAEAACELADAAAGYGWSAAAADDALAAIDILAAALAQIDPEAGEALAVVTAATATARQRLGLPADTEPEPSPTAPAVPAPRTGRRPRRRGLGPGFQGILDRPAG